MAAHKQKHGDKAVMALIDLTMADEQSKLTVLRPDARRACRVLLGPAPESDEYADSWKRQERQPPADHRQPGEKAPEPPAEQLRKKPVRKAAPKKPVKKSAKRKG